MAAGTCAAFGEQVDDLAEAVAEHHRRLSVDHVGEVIHLLAEVGAGTGRHGPPVPAPVVAHDRAVLQEADGAQERGAAIKGPVDEDDPRCGGGAEVLGHEEVSHGDAR